MEEEKAMEKKITDTFLGKYIHTVARNARKIMILCFISALLSSIWAITRTEKWHANAIAIVPGGHSAVISNMADLAAATSDLPGSFGANMAGSLGGLSLGSSGGLDIYLVHTLVTSRLINERLLLKYDLITRYEADGVEDALQELGEHVSVTLTPENFFIISAIGESREEATAMVNDIIDFANESLSTIVTSRARRSRILAEESVIAAEDSFLVAQARMQEFRERTGLIFPENQGIQITQLLGNLETKLLITESELAGLEGTVSASNPAYRELAARIDHLSSSIEEKLMDGDSLSIYPGIATMPEELAEYENLAMDLEARRIIYLTLTQHVESLLLEEERESPTLEVLVPATPAGLRSSPKRAFIVIRYTFMALFLALLWLAVLAYTKNVLDDSEKGPYWRSVFKTLRKQLFFK